MPLYGTEWREHGYGLRPTVFSYREMPQQLIKLITVEDGSFKYFDQPRCLGAGSVTNKGGGGGNIFIKSQFSQTINIDRHINEYFLNYS
jgi:hypothetical protein